MPMADVIFRRRTVQLPLIVLLTLTACMAGPPVQEMSDARQVIRAAHEAGVRPTSSDSLGEAERLLGQAETQLHRGEYRGARRNALAARDKAAEALRVVQMQASEHSG